MEIMKTFEYFKNNDLTNRKYPNVGEYVILQFTHTWDDGAINIDNNKEILLEWLESDIGQVLEIKKNRNNNIKAYNIKYNVPEHIQRYLRQHDNTSFVYFVYEDNIKFWSNNKEELEAIINSNKYNL
jgi:hypothetical protein